MAKKTASRTLPRPSASRPKAASSAAAAPVKSREEQQAETFFLGFMLVLITLIVFIPAYTSGFIWDDDQLLTANQQVHSAAGWWTLWLQPTTADYFPLTSTTLWIEYHLGNFFNMWNTDYLQHYAIQSPLNGYHIMNVLFHTIAVVLTWRVLVRLKIPGAWVAAAIFAIHPICVESVAWISERKNTISQIFFLLSLLEYLKFDETGKRRTYVTSVAMFALSLLAKTSVVMLPFVLLLLAWWKRIRTPSEEEAFDYWKRAVIRTIPFFAIAFVLGIVTVYFQYGRAIGTEVIPIGTIPERLMSACFAAGFYLYSALWPFNIIEIYPQWHRPGMPEFIPYYLQILPGVAYAALFALCWMRRSRPWAQAILFGLGFYLVTMLPALGLLTMSYMRLTLVADHFQYLSIIGVIALVVAGGTSRALKPAWLLGMGACFTVISIVNWSKTQDNQPVQIFWIAAMAILAVAWMMERTWPDIWKYAWSGFMGIVLVCFAFLSYGQTSIYHSEETLWTATLDKNPNSWQANNHLGAAIYSRGDPHGAYPYFARAVQLKPENPEVHNNLGLVLGIFGHPQESIAEYEKAVAIKDDPAMRMNLANAYAQQHEFDKAIASYQDTIKNSPDNPMAHCNLGITYAQMGRTNDAVQEFQKALEIDPNLEQAKQNLMAITQGRWGSPAPRGQ